MFIHRSNRMERLVEALASVIAAGPRDPLAPDTIVVQSQGMARYLSMRLSERFSVWANPAFPFPRTLVEQAFDALLPDAGGPLLDRTVLQLALAARLPERLDEPAFAVLARYLRDDHGDDRLLQLCARVAQRFDDYCVYRPEMVRGWEAGAEPDDWQASAMRMLRDAFGAYHVGARSQAFFEALERHRGALPGLPERLCVFGVSSLPPLYLRVLSALSTRLPVHLFLLSPTLEYWADLASPREQERVRRRAGSPTTTSLHLTEGHPLLASFGTLGRELSLSLENEEAHHHGEQEHFEEPGEGCLLHALQSDMLHLRRRGSARRDSSRRDPDDGDDRLVVAADDASLQVHVCHGPTREVEVLHDQLVALLEDDRLAPEDIVVMAPDIETYAPAIEAVFGRVPGGEARGRPELPFRIADRGLSASHPAFDALCQLLDLLPGRFEAPAVLDVLALEPVRRRFGIAAEELETVRTWVDRAGIRWGVDAEHRRDLGQPALVATTWRFGLERLMLGYAMEGHGHRLFAARLPFDHVEGSQADLLGRLAAFCDMLFVQRTAVAGEHSVAEWQRRLSALMEAALAVDEGGQQELQAMREALDALATDAAATGLTRALGLPALRRLLEERLVTGRGALGFMAGGITFCQLVPMRSLPFQVVALLGMDDESFPRRDRALGFDRLRQAPRPGDRSLRNDDRYLFLEAILSARRTLLISYVGRGIHDNGLRPPSVVVSELLDALDRDFRFAAGSARAQLCVEHRLQPFSPAYFGASTDRRLFSYARHYHRGAASLRAALPAAAPFCAAPLPEPVGAGPLELGLIERYAGHPVRAFMQERLGLFLGRDLEPLEARERLVLDPLSRWQVGDRLLRLSTGPALRGVAIERLATATAATGELPLGVPGQLSFDRLVPSLSTLVEHIERLGEGAFGERPTPFSVDLDGVSIEGHLEGLCEGALVSYQYSRVGRRSELAVFWRHVILNCLAHRTPERGLPRTSVLLGRADSGDGITLVEFTPVPEPEGLLGGLLSWLGWSRRFPMPFEIGASRRYAELRHAGTDAEEALRRARNDADNRDARDGRDPYLALAYPDFDSMCAPPEGPGFEAAALAVFEPLLAHRRERGASP